MPPVAAVDDDRVDFVHALDRLAQRSGRQAQAVAHAAHAVDDGDLERAGRAGSAASRRPTARRRRGVCASSRRAAATRSGPATTGQARAAREQHGLVADFDRVVCRAATARGQSVALAAVAARHDARRACRAASAASASQITNGVLPVPPTLTLPTTITGTGSVDGFNASRARYAGAAQLRERAIHDRRRATTASAAGSLPYQMALSRAEATTCASHGSTSARELHAVQRRSSSRRARASSACVPVSTTRAVAHDDDPVGPLDRGEAMRDHERRAAAA